MRLLWRCFGEYIAVEDADIDQDLIFDKVIGLRGNFSTAICSDYDESNTSRALIEMLHDFRKLDRGKMVNFWVSFLFLMEIGFFSFLVCLRCFHDFLHMTKLITPDMVLTITA